MVKHTLWMALLVAGCAQQTEPAPSTTDVVDPWKQYQVEAPATVMADGTSCPPNYVVKPDDPNDCTPAPGMVADQSQFDRINAESNQRFAAAADQRQENERAYQLRQQATESSYQQQRAIEEATFNAQQQPAYARAVEPVPSRADFIDPYNAPVPVEAPSEARIIRNANSMPNVTTVQVAPDRVWDYSTGQYKWADEQADGSLQQRGE
jgi:hypothetical protein